MCCLLLKHTYCLLQAKKYERAIALLVKHGWWERLLALMRSLDKAADVKHITAAVAAFRRAGALSLHKLSPPVPKMTVSSVICVLAACACMLTSCS